MADIDLPVFSFRPNWREPVSERLSFLTDVRRATEGAEQRASLRTTPRRSFEVDLLLTEQERTFWDLFTNRLAGTEVMAPLIWDFFKLPATAGIGTTRINFKTQESEFKAGTLAILSGKTALDYEVVQITGVDANGINVVATARTWPVGTRLMPLRRCLIDSTGDLSHFSATVAVVTSRLNIVVPNPRVVPVDPATLYLARPVFQEEPNWVAPLTHSQDRLTSIVDNELGLPFQRDVIDRALTAQSHRWFLPGRQRLALFRDLLYRHAGQTRSVWLPTFKNDLRLAVPTVALSAQITVKNVGYLYTGGPEGGREHIAIRHGGGTIFRKVLSVLPGLTADTERLNLDNPVGLALSPGQVRKISFMDVARFDQDDFEIVHHAGLDGLHECTASFRSFKDSRTAPLPISYPIPVAVLSSEPCNPSVEPELDDCYTKGGPTLVGLPLASSVSNSNNLLVNLGDPAIGELLVVVGENNSFPYQAPSIPADWAFLFINGAGALRQIYCIFKVANGSDTCNLFYANRADIAATCFRFRRYQSTNPLNYAFAASLPPSVDLPGTSETDAFAIVLGSSDSTSGPVSSPAGYTDLGLNPLGATRMAYKKLFRLTQVQPPPFSTCEKCWTIVVNKG